LDKYFCMVSISLKNTFRVTVSFTQNIHSRSSFFFCFFFVTNQMTFFKSGSMNHTLNWIDSFKNAYSLRNSTQLLWGWWFILFWH